MNAGTIVVIFLVILIIGACLFSFVRRFTGKESCCETNIPRIKPKKLKTTIGSFALQIEGMRCESCRRTLMLKLNELDGISAKVNLEKQMAVISYEHPVEYEKIIEVVESAGFVVRVTEKGSKGDK